MLPVYGRFDKDTIESRERGGAIDPDKREEREREVKELGKKEPYKGGKGDKRAHRMKVKKNSLSRLEYVMRNKGLRYLTPVWNISRKSRY